MTKNPKETLYNGIELPDEWPPRNIDRNDGSVLPVPYLKTPPKVIPIDVGRQLFVDDFLIEKMDMKRVFHSPKKYDGNPVMKPETKLELNPKGNAATVPKSGGVWWDPQEKNFKMWYEAGWIHTLCYATSKDGITWERPEFDSKGGTNRVLTQDLLPDSGTVVPDWDCPDPAQRYKMYMHGPSNKIPAVCMTSPDGVHWSNRVWTGISDDRSTMFYNPFRKKWIFSLRDHKASPEGPGRYRRYWECDDFLTGCQWRPDEPVMWARTDGDDSPTPGSDFLPQLYNLDAVAYESVMLGIFQILRGSGNMDALETGIPKITELNLAYSRDGFHWHRPDRNMHISPNREKGAWDRGYVQSVGSVCCVCGDELWFYYTGFRGDESKADTGDWLTHGMYSHGATGIAILRRDGFVSMDADNATKSLTTRPLVFSGRNMFVNAAIGGELRVEIQDESGKALAPFTLGNCPPVSGDSTIAPVCWEGAENLSVLRGKPVRFHFSLTRGSLYAFWVSKDETGRSDGYVAGGGPGFTGMTDTIGKDIE